jgi:hypothetical protein
MTFNDRMREMDYGFMEREELEEFIENAKDFCYLHGEDFEYDELVQEGQMVLNSMWENFDEPLKTRKFGLNYEDNLREQGLYLIDLMQGMSGRFNCDSVRVIKFYKGMN